MDCKCLLGRSFPPPDPDPLDSQGLSTAISPDLPEIVDPFSGAIHLFGIFTLPLTWKKTM